MKRKTINRTIALLCALALTCSSGSFVFAAGSPSGENITSVVKEVEIKNENGEVKKVEVFAENIKVDLSKAKNKAEEKKIVEDFVEKAAAPILQHIENVAKNLGLKTNAKEVKQIKETVQELFTLGVTNAPKEEFQTFKEKKQKEGTFKDDTTVKTEAGTTTIRVKDVKEDKEETVEIANMDQDVISVSELLFLKMREKNTDAEEETDAEEKTDGKEQGESIVLDDNFELEIKLEDLTGVTDEDEEDVMYIVSVYSLEDIEENGEIRQVMVESYVNATIETVEVEPEAESENLEAEAETEKQEAETEVAKKDTPKEEKVLRAVLPPNAVAAEVKKVKTKKASTKKETTKKESSDTKGKDKLNDKNKTSNKKEK